MLWHSCDVGGLSLSLSLSLSLDSKELKGEPSTMFII